MEGGAAGRLSDVGARCVQPSGAYSASAGVLPTACGLPTGSELGLQGLSLRIFAGRSALPRISYLGLGQVNCALLSPLGQLQPLVQLLKDVGVPRFVDLEGFAALGADDFMHGGWESSLWLDWEQLAQGKKI